MSTVLPASSSSASVDPRLLRRRGRAVMMMMILVTDTPCRAATGTPLWRRHLTTIGRRVGSTERQRPRAHQQDPGSDPVGSSMMFDEITTRENETKLERHSSTVKTTPTSNALLELVDELLVRDGLRVANFGHDGLARRRRADDLDVENEVARDAARLAVRRPRGAVDLGAVADGHRRERLVPARDDAALADGHRDGLAALPRRVEDLAVLGGRADVVDRGDVAGAQRGARAADVRALGDAVVDGLGRHGVDLGLEALFFARAHFGFVFLRFERRADLGPRFVGERRRRREDPLDEGRLLGRRFLRRRRSKRALVPRPPRSFRGRRAAAGQPREPDPRRVGLRLVVGVLEQEAQVELVLAERELPDGELGPLQSAGDRLEGALRRRRRRGARLDEQQALARRDERRQRRGHDRLDDGARRGFFFVVVVSGRGGDRRLVRL
mmetsp:Transcript_6237/g.26145  ORF Transcript_6237/g.26145 Transcript_6237/m.26145 type:complete len:440 (-) Transcript_6237:1027-2346(-)